MEISTSLATMIKIEISGRNGYPFWGTPMADGPSSPDKDDINQIESTYRCFVPSNRLDFLMAYNSSPPFRCTLMTFPNWPLPTSSISTKSRSNLPGCSSAKESDNRRVTRVGLGPRRRGDGTVARLLFVGELSVAIELDDDPE